MTITLTPPSLKMTIHTLHSRCEAKDDVWQFTYILDDPAARYQAKNDPCQITFEVRFDQRTDVTT